MFIIIEEKITLFGLSLTYPLIVVVIYVLCDPIGIVIGQLEWMVRRCRYPSLTKLYETFRTFQTYLKS